MSTPDTIPVPPLNLVASFEQVRDEVLAEMQEVAASGYYVLGPKVVAFEQALAEYCGVKHALGLSSGTDALLLAMMALGIGRDDEVIVPTFTFFATAGCVARLGARPVFCDIDPKTFNIDVKQLEERITLRTKAVIPVHLYGQMADLRPIFQAVNRHGIAVIEDAAQAIGAVEPEPHRGKAGALGTFGCLSFYPTKNLGAMGEAGALLTNSDKLHDLATKLRLHGETSRYHHARIGGNFKIDALQAAILSVKLRHLDGWIEQRRARAAGYTERITAAGLAPDLVQPPAELHGRHVYHQYVIRAQRRDELAEFLRGRGIGAGVYYPVPLHMQECFAYLGGREGDFPHSERAAREVLGLPIYPELTDPQQGAVVAALATFYARRRATNA